MKNELHTSQREPKGIHPKRELYVIQEGHVSFQENNCTLFKKGTASNLRKKKFN